MHIYIYIFPIDVNYVERMQKKDVVDVKMLGTVIENVKLRLGKGIKIFVIL